MIEKTRSVNNIAPGFVPLPWLCAVVVLVVARAALLVLDDLVVVAVFAVAFAVAVKVVL